LSTFKTFSISVLKIACGLAAAAILLGLLAWGIVAYRERSEERANAPLAALRTWPVVTVDVLEEAHFSLRTVWRDTHIYYQFELVGYPSSIRRARDRVPEAAFTLYFSDKDGFRLFEHRVPLAEMTGIVGSDGQPVSLSWKGDEYLNVDLYRRAQTWEFVWSGISTTPEAAPPREPSRNLVPRPAAAKWHDVSLWRNLVQGASKDDVRRILGDAGKVSESGYSTIWYYGYPLGGEVMFGRDGKVESWTEP
jgi:hypothetical protein